MTPAAVILEVGLGLAGLCLGSFAATAALRFARAEPFLAGRSRCDGCGASLSYWRTVPVVSYISRGGACHACGARIEPLHVWGELAGAGVVLASFAVAAPPRAALIAILGLALLAAAIFDVKTQRLPNGLTLVVAAPAIALSGLRGGGAALAGLAAGAATIATLAAVRFVYRRRRGVDGLGLGDVKLAGALALWLGLATPWGLAVGAGLGLAGAGLTGAWGRRFAFGPALAAGGFIVGLVEEGLKWQV